MAEPQHQQARTSTPPRPPPLPRFTSSSTLSGTSSHGRHSPQLPPSPTQSNAAMRRVPSSGWGKVGTSGDPTLSKRRARNLLRDYYGLSNQASEDPASGAAGGGGGPSGEVRASKGKASDRAGAYAADDFDSPHFDPQTYFSSFVSSASVPALLGKANSLMVEIRELDGERQSLVYNHHHELVEASGTIGKMKATSETLDTSLDQLQASFASISSLASSLSRPLPPHLASPAPPFKNTTTATPSYSPTLHLPPLLSLPTLLRSLLSPPRTHRAEADRLWGEWEPALRSFEERGVNGAKEVGDECRDVLRNARRGSVGEAEAAARPVALSASA